MDAAPAEAAAENNEVDSVIKQLIEAVGDLSVVARALERWPVFAPPIGVSVERQQLEQQKFERAETKGKQRIVEHLRRFMRKSRRITEIVSPTFDQVNLPQDLVNHIDAYLSPNLWLRGLVTEVQYSNDIARGELTALGSLHSTVQFYLNVIQDLQQPGSNSGVSVPDFSLPFQPPTVLRPPVLYDSSKTIVSIPHILRMLSEPIRPYDLQQDPRETKQRLFNDEPPVEVDDKMGPENDSQEEEDSFNREAADFAKGGPEGDPAGEVGEDDESAVGSKRPLDGEDPPPNKQARTD